MLRLRREASWRTLHRAGAEIATGNAITQSGQAERLGPDAAGTIENGCHVGQIAELVEDRVQSRSLFFHRTLPVFKNQVVVIGQLIVGLGRVHGQVF